MRPLPLVKKLQLQLVQQGDAQKKAWWENYIKQELPFLGVGLAQVERELRQWYRDENIAAQPLVRQLDTALYLFSQPYAEDKLAAVLLCQKYLCAFLPWSLLIDKFDLLWRNELIYDWSICDWFCLRVLRQLLDRHGLPCARQLAAWRDAPYLWQARSALVPFVGRTMHKRYRQLIMPTCRTLLRRDERFAKTAVGWIMREFSKTELQLVLVFLHQQRQYLTREVINNALKYYPAERQKFTRQG